MKPRSIAITLVLAILLIGAALSLDLQPGTLTSIGVGAGIATWRNRRRRARDRAFWTVVWRLRRAHVDDRERLLAELEPAKLRGRVKAVLARDGSNEVEGDVERFPFPRGLRRLATRSYWTFWALGVMMLGIAAFLPGPVWPRCLLLLIAGCCVFGAWAAARRERSYDSVIEVTPFRLRELLPDGSTRTAAFSQYLVLHNEPERRRLRVAPGGDDPGIVLDYRRMGFDRLVDLVIRYGGFVTDDERRAAD